MGCVSKREVSERGRKVVQGAKRDGTEMEMEKRGGKVVQREYGRGSGGIKIDI